MNTKIGWKEAPSLNMKIGTSECLNILGIMDIPQITLKQSVRCWNTCTNYSD